MDDSTRLISQNLKNIREEKRISLDKLAELTGVSKSMLGQIERGESSPTIATIWKIANGLKISFTALLTAPQADIRLVRRADLQPLVEDNGKYLLYPYFPIEEGRRFEVYGVEIEQGGYLSAEAHPAGTQEFLTVFAGELTVRVNNQEFALLAGDSLRFKADSPHVYHNSGEALTKLSMVICYNP
jgi:transcriptional regulator with XRE-family HTH domain